METWNNLVDKFDLLLEKIKLGSTVKIAGREISPVLMGFVFIVICIPIWGYLEFEGDNKLIGALVVILMAWALPSWALWDWVTVSARNRAVPQPISPLQLALCLNLPKTPTQSSMLWTQVKLSSISSSDWPYSHSRVLWLH